MDRNRLSLALEQLDGSDWKRFEDFASEFLAAGSPSLRVVAAPGDRGRDAFLYVKADEPEVLLQFSVAADWGAKIAATAKTIRTNFPEAQTFVYVTNQRILAAGDEVREQVRKDLRLHIDIRDCSYFLDRRDSTVQTTAASEQLAADIADRYLASRGVIESKAQALDSTEAKAAFVFLALQWEDDTREKGLTKVAFDALVRQSLSETTPESRLTRAQVHERVRAMLPGDNPSRVEALSDTALGRLAKKEVRHYEKPDEFCLSFEERTRLADRLAALEARDSSLEDAARSALEDSARKIGVTLPEDQGDLLSRVRRVLEKVLLLRGEAFAESVSRGTTNQMRPEDVYEVVVSDLAAHPDPSKQGADLFKIVIAAVSAILERPSSEVSAYLRSLADVYTLFAFLRQTPDVQSVVSKIFSGGEIWLDTNIVIPLFVDDLLEPEFRNYSTLLAATRDTGSRLYVTDGVLEELDGHIRASLACASSQSWQGPPPFLLSAYLLSGRPLRDFVGWVRQFRGSARPEEDVGGYLREFHRIDRLDLAADASVAPPLLKETVLALWRAKHEQRRSGSPDVAALTDHDVENSLGVIQRRKNEESTPFGYRSWWLTLDRFAFDLSDRILARSKLKVSSPAMSPDFLLNYVSIGPRRSTLSKDRQLSLPLVMRDATTLGVLPEDLLRVAGDARAAYKGLPEHVINREVRDGLDAARIRRGYLAEAGAARSNTDFGTAAKQRQTST